MLKLNFGPGNLESISYMLKLDFGLGNAASISGMPKSDFAPGDRGSTSCNAKSSVGSRFRNGNSRMLTLNGCSERMGHFGRD
jgi:hypothetical protein